MEVFPAVTFLCQIFFSNFKKAFVGEVEINPPHTLDSVADVLLASYALEPSVGREQPGFQQQPWLTE